MKKHVAVLSLVLCLILSLTATAFADEPIMTILSAPNTIASAKGTMTIESITPKDGQTGLQPTNIAIKIEFSEDVSDTAYDEINKNKVSVQISNPEEGTEVVVYNADNDNMTLVHHDKSPNELWYILDGTLSTNTEYTITVDSGVTASSGNTLADSAEYTFKVRNTKIDSWISLGMMVVMMGFMFYTTSKAAKKAAMENDPAAVAKAKEAALNPYKIAKEKNISLEEAQAIVAKEKAKVEKEKKKAAEELKRRELEKQMEQDLIEQKVEEAMAAERAASVFHVKGPKSLKASGHEVPKSISKKKKARIAAAEEAERRAAEERAARSKGKKSKK